MKAYIIVEEWMQVKRYIPQVYLNKDTASKVAKEKKESHNSMHLTSSDFYVEEIKINED